MEFFEIIPYKMWWERQDEAIPVMGKAILFGKLIQLPVGPLPPVLDFIQTGGLIAAA